MAFIWVDSASKIKSPYEVKSSQKKVERVERINPHDETGSGTTDTFTLSEEYQEAAGHSAYKQASQKREKSHTPLYAEQIMSSPVKTLSTSHSLTDALEFIKTERYRHVPILNPGGALIGIISDRDVFRYYYDINDKAVADKKNITDLVRSRVLTASPDTRISEIARIMFDERIGAMPVLDESHQLVGMITRSDILRTILKRSSMEFWV
jgi:acetoin utilization protein AcuB